jgi:hypothetical protein
LRSAPCRVFAAFRPSIVRLSVSAVCSARRSSAPRLRCALPHVDRATRPGSRAEIRAYNGSLDAAKALHGAMLPGWRWLVEGNGNASVYPPDENLLKAVDVDGAVSPARAWLLAIIKALISQGDTQ